MRRVRGEADAYVDEDSAGIRRVRERLFEAPAARRPKRRWIVAGSVAASMAAAAALVVWLAADRPAPAAVVTYEVEGRPAPDRRWIAAPPDVEVPIRFSDGAEVLLRPDSDLTVAHLRANGASVRVERGAVAIRVPRDPARPRDWRVLAGPFEVRVRGTEFEVDWDTAAAHFRLEMRHGEVELRGPVVGARRARSGERVEVWLRDQRMEVVAASAEARAPEAVEPVSHAGEPAPSEPALEPIDRARENDRASPPRRAPEAPRSESPSSPDVLEEIDAHTRAGRFDEAVAVADRTGWSQILARMSAERALRLGDAARYAGRVDRASEVYRTVRSRFPGTPPAAEAALHLGRLAADQQRDSIGASEWLDTYLREAPNGRFAREALGRRLEIEHRMGHAPRARELAGDYLRRFGEDGPYSDLALQLAGRD